MQDPDDAADGSMPRATVATGVADVVLPVGALARRFIELARAKRQLNPGVREPEQAPAILAFVSLYEAQRYAQQTDATDDLSRALSQLRRALPWRPAAPAQRG